MNAVAKKVTKAHARKVLEMVNHGLVKGLGKQEPGKMCIEAAVCYALGEPHGDNPSCVGEAVRAFKIRLNDANWPSDQGRADGLREIAIAQLGSNEIDQREFANRVVLKTIQQILPIALRAAAKMIPAHANALEASAVACGVVVNLVDGRVAALSARNATAAAAAYADAAAYAYAAAVAAAAAAADAAAAAVASTSTTTTTRVAAAAAAADYAADAAAASTSTTTTTRAAAAAAAYAAKRASHLAVLCKAAAIGVEVLKEMDCKGTKWLDIIQ